MNIGTCCQKCYTKDSTVGCSNYLCECHQKPYWGYRLPSDFDKTKIIDIKPNEYYNNSMYIYKHIVYNPKRRLIEAVIKDGQADGNDWCFERVQPITEYECVAIFSKWLY